MLLPYSFPNIESEKAARLTVVSWHIIRRHCVRKNDLRFSRFFRVFYSRQDVPRTDGIAYVLRDRWFIVDRARNFTNTFERFFFFFFFFVKVKRIVIQIIVIFVKSEMIHGEDNRERQESLKLKSGFRNRYLWNSIHCEFFSFGSFGEYNFN